jgi:biotin transport system substrate-specific component
MIWLSRLMGVSKSVMSAGLYPFVVGDLAKIALAAAVLPAGWKLLKYGGFDGKRR